jgi:hypothetical protein
MVQTILENEQKGWKTHKAFLTGLWIIMLVCSLFLIVTFLSRLLPSIVSQHYSSLDWSGYEVNSDSANPKPVVIGVGASWIVPRITVSSSDSYSAVWIGIGGQSDKDNTLIQTGTEQDSLNGKVTYSIWYELLPRDSVTINSMKVSPGDEINATISLTSSPTNLWTIEINDITKGETFKQNFNYNSNRFSAGWIVERPTINGVFSTLANFGNVTFNNSRATVNNVTGAISNFPNAQITMVNRQNKQLTAISSLTAHGSSFTVTYLVGTTTQSQMIGLIEFETVIESTLEQGEQFRKRRYNMICVDTFDFLSTT